MPDPAPYTDCGIVGVECMLGDRVLAVSFAGWIAFLSAPSGMPGGRAQTSSAYRRLLVAPDELSVVSFSCSRLDLDNVQEASSIFICKLAR